MELLTKVFVSSYISFNNAKAMQAGTFKHKGLTLPLSTYLSITNIDQKEEKNPVKKG